MINIRFELTLSATRSIQVWAECFCWGCVLNHGDRSSDLDRFGVATVDAISLILVSCSLCDRAIDHFPGWQASEQEIGLKGWGVIGVFVVVVTDLIVISRVRGMQNECRHRK